MVAGLLPSRSCHTTGLRYAARICSSAPLVAVTMLALDSILFVYTVTGQVTSRAFAMTRPIEDLLRHRHLWRAADGPGADRGTFTTGFASLDAELAGQGWPEDGLTEILSDAVGVGELRLLLPALARLSQHKPRWIAWIGAPHLPYAPALAAAGLDVDRMLLIHPKNHQDHLWATEQALKSGTCSAVLSWPDPNHLRHADLRRLQIAAREGNTWGVMFRPESAAATASPAELRLLIESWDGDAGTLGLRVLKRRGGWPTEGIGIEFEDALTRRMAGPEQAAALRQLALWKPAGHGRKSTSTGRPDSMHPASARPGVLAAVTAASSRRQASTGPHAPGATSPATITPLPNRGRPHAGGAPIRH